MKLKVTQFLTRLILILIFIEFISTPFVQANNITTTQYTLQDKHQQSPLANFFFEKTEEGEKEERDKFLGVQLADFSSLEILISRVHTPGIHIITFKQYCASKLSLFKLFCIYII